MQFDKRQDFLSSSLIFLETVHLQLQSGPETANKMQNMETGKFPSLESGIQKKEIIHSLIKHSFEREERNILVKKNSFFSTKHSPPEKRILFVQISILIAG